MKNSRFLYHGSSERVGVLMPQQAQDWRHKEGSQNGIYATSNRDVALAFALGAIPDETGSVSRVMGGTLPLRWFLLKAIQISEARVISILCLAKDSNTWEVPCG